jgi:hypothetical protein
MAQQQPLRKYLPSFGFMARLDALYFLLKVNQFIVSTLIL